MLFLVPIVISVLIGNSYKDGGETFEVIALQPNIDPYNEKYSFTNDAIADLLIKLSNQEISSNTSVILAPETVFADNVRLNQFNNSSFKFKLDAFVSANPKVNWLTGVSFIQFIYDKNKVKPKSNQLRASVV